MARRFTGAEAPRATAGEQADAGSLGRDAVDRPCAPLYETWMADIAAAHDRHASMPVRLRNRGHSDCTSALYHEAFVFVESAHGGTHLDSEPQHPGEVVDKSRF